MQLRSFSTISVKNTAENLAHTTALGYSHEIVRGNIVIDIPETHYQFADNARKLKEALGF